MLALIIISRDSSQIDAQIIHTETVDTGAVVVKVTMRSTAGQKYGRRSNMSEVRSYSVPKLKMLKSNLEQSQKIVCNVSVAEESNQVNSTKRDVEGNVLEK